MGTVLGYRNAGREDQGVSDELAMLSCCMRYRHPWYGEHQTSLVLVSLMLMLGLIPVTTVQSPTPVARLSRGAGSQTIMITVRCKACRKQERARQSPRTRTVA